MVIDGTFRKAISNLTKYQSTILFWDRNHHWTHHQSSSLKVRGNLNHLSNLPNWNIFQTGQHLWALSSVTLLGSQSVLIPFVLPVKEILFFYSSISWHCTEQIIIRKPPEGKVTIQLSIFTDEPYFYHTSKTSLSLSNSELGAYCSLAGSLPWEESSHKDDSNYNSSTKCEQ